VRKLPTYVRLAWGLLRDPRVPGEQKLILAGIAGYLVMPLDIIPDLIPVFGQLDDLAVMLLGLRWFISLAPQDVVADHLARIARNEDDLRHDIDQVQRLLGERFDRIRDDLDRILARQRDRFRGTDDAGDELRRWQERRPTGPPGGSPREDRRIDGKGGTGS
jgi:uncharacterized membrane protein YkvA (DUF1232 family)